MTRELVLDWTILMDLLMLATLHYVPLRRIYGALWCD